MNKLLNSLNISLTKDSISDNVDSSCLMQNKRIFSWPASFRGSAYRHLSLFATDGTH